MTMTSKEIRQKFLEYFESKEHLILPSAPLVPKDDPTLLWINAGMAPFKSYFDGRATPPNTRVSNSQKCIRTNDIENVGNTARHHTLFEMLGNFSFGDYFKEEAIKWSYEFLTEEMKLDSSKFWISIYKDDEEAFDIWVNQIGIPKERVVRMGKDENFWEIGTGPCGPCSEIHYDMGADFGCSDDCKFGCECDRYREVWNLVFTQYDLTDDGEYNPLPNKNIDTGMGLERLASIVQGVDTNYETDLFQPITNFIGEHTEFDYQENDDITMAYRVIADHIRGVTFAIGDGVLPSNEGRGYVIRRILRRAVRYAKKLNLKVPFLHKIVPVIVDIMGDVYPEITEKEEQIKKVIKNEAIRFQETLDQGIQILEELIEELDQNNQEIIPGDKVFTLYDTYGFPKELTEEIAKERGYKIDEAGFESAMAEQRARARAAREDHEQDHAETKLFKEIRNEINKPEFVGYTMMESKADVLKIVIDNKMVNSLKAGEEGLVILSKTPFYAESGGQIGDQGALLGDELTATVVDTQEKAELIIHQVVVEEGELALGTELTARVKSQRRKDIRRNHTATHLVHEALRETLGEHVEQSGSLVEPNRLRFDFTHFEAITDEELREIEEKVNQQVMNNLEVEVLETTLEEAKELGATALFSEKYSENVRVVRIGDYSLELCGGTHVAATGEISLCKIVNESGIAAGVRRIEAVTGEYAIDYINHRENILKEVATKLKTNPDNLIERTEKLQTEIKELEGEITALKDKLANSQVDDLISNQEEINDINVILEKVEGMDADGLRTMGDNMKTEIESGVILLASNLGEKVLFVSIVTQDLVNQGFNAGQIIGEVARVAGGGGGGRPDMAQAGGSQPEKLDDAFEKAREIIAGN
ncbi:alanine--tRNA ligase [Selenihalanaerobacter shriftii]|uniref:Alanine--tRNA ligase n=1 Tax=Selenihalanaerobacter shriftii TaxID=142842 RepID=A0A1T4QLE5_9FIRM|nr:alanine--tRNA ligase [Selenihalanaerobacter shriftii]SKA04603.1 alanyl-tRNA synthetase [Selenihalanaerobacter shriftii]